MPPPIQFPGYVPNSVAIQQLWPKTDLKGIGRLVHLKSESFEILEREMDTIWLPWGTSKKKEKAWLKKALGLEDNLIQDDVIHSDSSLGQQEIPESIVPEGLHEKESEKELEMEELVSKTALAPELYAQLKEFLTSMAVPETWDPASTYATDESSEPVLEFLVSLLNQEWFQKYYPDFNLEEVIDSEELREKEHKKEQQKEREKEQLVPEEVIDSEELREKEHKKERQKEREKEQLVPEEVIDSEGLPEKEHEKEQEKEQEKAQLVYEAYPECFTVEGVATMLLKILEQSSYEDGPQIMMVLVYMMAYLGSNFRKKLQQLLLKLLNKEPPPNLVDKIEKKFVMMALQVLMVVSLGSRDLVLELMSYFLYSPPRCRPALKKLLEELGLKDPHNFLFKEMVTWAEGKDLTNKAALRGRCGQKLELMIKNLKSHLKQNLLLPAWKEEDKEISVSPGEHRSPESLSPATKTEYPHLKFPQPPAPAPFAKFRAISRFIPKQPPKSSPKVSPEVSPKPSTKASPKPSTKASPKPTPKLSPKPSPRLSPRFYPDLPTTIPTFLSPLTGRSPRERVLSPKSSTPLESRAVTPPSFRFLSFSQTPSMRRAISEPHWGPILEKPLIHLSAPASIAGLWVPFLDYESPTMESSMSAPPSPQEIEIEVTPIDALNFFCEQQLQAQNERIKMRRALRHARPNTIVTQPRGIMLSTYQSTHGRKILRLQERGSSLRALDTAGVTNVQRARCRMGTISRSMKLPLPRVEPIPFPPAWPPPSRPLPPLILEDSLQRYFLPKLARPENYH